MTERLMKSSRWLRDTLFSLFSGFVRFVVGFLCCWTPFTAPLLSGWMNRYMLRSAVQVWVKRSTLEDSASFFNSQDVSLLKYWPRWSDVSGLEQSLAAERKDFSYKLYLRVKRFLRALFIQYRNGVLSLFNTWLLTLPFALVWLWMWWAGWNNTFSRGYEEEGLAAVLSVASVIGFSFIMLYLPIAQARRALHGRWKSFFDFRAVRAIARHVRFRLLILALFYALGSAGLMAGTKIFPAFFEQAYHIDLENPKAVKDAVFGHFFIVILCFYCGLLIVKRMNARVYAIGVLKALRSQALNHDQLSPFERDLLLNRLHFAPADPRPALASWRTKLLRTIKAASRLVLVLATLAVWGSVAFSVYFGQFMNLSHVDWLNQPMIQMPYIRVPEIHVD